MIGTSDRTAGVTVSLPAQHWLQGVLGKVDTTDVIFNKRPLGTQVSGMSASLAWRYGDDLGKVVVEQPEGAASWLAHHEQRRHRRRR
jgi:hypothetical protein